MKLTLQRSVRWRPPVFGNLDLPEGEQVEVEIKVPTAGEYSEIVSRSTGRAFPSRQVWLDHVTAIRNLSAEIDGKVQQHLTAEDVVDQPGLGSLLETTVVKILGLAAAPDPT